MFKHLRLFFIYGASTLLLLTNSYPASAQGTTPKFPTAEPFEYWIDHLPYNTFHHVDQLGELTFAAADQGLLIFNDEAGEYERFSTINGLSDAGITALCADPSSGQVWMGYASGRIDIWTPNQGFRNLNAIEESPQYNGLKTINDITFHDGRAYIATDFGIVEFNTGNFLAERTFILGPNSTPTSITALATTPAGMLYAVTPQLRSQALIRRGQLSENLVFYANWSPLTSTATWEGNHLCYDPSQSAIILAKQGNIDSELLRLDSDSTFTTFFTTPQTIADLNSSTEGTNLVATLDFNIMLFEGGTQTTNISSALFPPGSFNPICATFDESSENVFIGNFKSGLIRSRNLSANKIIMPNSPYSDRIYKLRAYGLGRNNPVVPNSNPYADPYRGNEGGMFLLSGALNDLWTRTFVADGIGRYSGQNWAHTDRNKLYGLTDFIDAAYHNDGTTEKLYLSSWGGGLVEITNDDTTAHYNTTNTDGVLKGVNGNASDLRTGGVCFDENGTLWGVQSLVTTPLYSMDTEGNFTAHTLSPGADAVALKDVVISDGMIFIQSRTNGIYGYTQKDGASLRRQITSGVGSGNLPSDKVLSMAVDQDGELWIGTDEGIVVLYSPENIFDGTGNVDARPILFEEDGVVQKLLGETPITSIFVDGGNRKWIGTRGAGIFLVNPDGLQTIHQFTSSNSPLLSNSIVDISADPTSGEVLIATDKGLIGYRGDASPAYTGSEPELHLFPNPVRPNYNGPIFIQGCQENARLKITDITGALVYETLANGGQASWEGTFLDGTKVPSGVYLIYATDDLGEVVAQGKVLIVR